MTSDKTNYIGNICHTAMNIQYISSDINKMETSLWDLIDKSMNTMIGTRV